MNVFQKIKLIEEQAQLVFGTKFNKNFAQVISRLCHYKRGHIREITFEEKELLDFLIQKGYNLRTIDEYFRLKNAPNDLKEKLSLKKIGIKKALREITQRKKKRYCILDKELINDIRKFVRCLK